MNHIPRQKTYYEEAVWEEKGRSGGEQESPDRDTGKHQQEQHRPKRQQTDVLFQGQYAQRRKRQRQEKKEGDMASKITLNPDRKDNGTRQTESSQACSGLKRKDPDRQHVESYGERSEWHTESCNKYIRFCEGSKFSLRLDNSHDMQNMEFLAQ